MHPGKLPSRVAAYLRLGSLILAAAGVGHGSTVNLLPNVNSGTLLINSISNTVATGATMVGITVTANFQDINTSATSSEIQTWAATAVGGGPGVLGTNFSLAEAGDTGLAASIWTLTNLSETLAITSIIIDGLPGNTVFDRSTDNITSPASGHTIGVGAAGSDTGGDYAFSAEYKGNLPYTVNVTYSDIVGLVSNPACQGAAVSPNAPNSGTCGDLFRTLTFAFSPAGGTFVSTHPGIGNQTQWVFTANTDLFDTAVPEPMTVELLGLGLLGLGAFTRMRAR